MTDTLRVFMAGMGKAFVLFDSRPPRRRRRSSAFSGRTDLAALRRDAMVAGRDLRRAMAAAGGE